MKLFEDVNGGLGQAWISAGFGEEEGSWYF